MKKVPYMLIIGQKEVDNKNVSFRRSGSEETITVSYEEFINILKEDSNSKARYDK